MPPKKEKDPNAPKRPMGPFFLWLVPSMDLRITRENREQLKEQGFKGSDAAKEGGRLWRELGDKSEWESKAADLKKNYEKEMMAYNAGK
ncbi:HMG box domain-containing protein [Aphelenchoides besseyi]|nr:HMG box domain-containing protein [Aphelenchoides besseyi]